MAWPYTRLTTYTPATPPKSNDLNAMQDQHATAQLAIDDLAHGERVLVIAGTAGTPESGVNFAPQRTPLRGTINSPGTVYYEIPLREGDRIKSITFSRKGDGVADISTLAVLKTTGAGVDAALVTTNDLNPAAAWADHTIGGFNYVLAAGETVTLQITTNAAGISIGNVRVTYDRP